MAKLETRVKSKGKKRKHSCAETEDEVANKSVILETNAEEHEPMETNSESAQTPFKKKSKKRKSKENDELLKKRCKSQLNGADNEPSTNHKEENELSEPTLEELKESEKAENNLAIVTGRQKKKQKYKKLLVAQKDQSVERETQRNYNYLVNWKNSRDSWKFEKLRQISIQQTMFESDKLDMDLWPIALEYMAGSKGSAKDKIVKLANDIIEEVDKLSEQQETEQERLNILNTTKYQRARDLLQIFN